MSERADAVIIGGGIIGAAVAFYLARERVGRVILLEKEPFLGSGATAKAAGGIRAQFSTQVNISMSMLSETLFERFADDTGYHALFDQVGYLFLATNETDATAYMQHNALQRSLGLDARIVTPDDIRGIAPHARVDDVILGTYCPKDGLGDPYEFLSGYIEAARRMGVEVRLESPVNGIDIRGEKVRGVTAPTGKIETGIVINCAGPYSKLIGEMVGSPIQIDPIRRQIVTTGPLPFVKPTFPMVVDVASGLYCHKESDGMLLGWADKSVRPSFDTSIDPDYTDKILERALDRIPELEIAEIANVWAGLYETTPDHHAIIGRDPVIEGFIHAAGFSGHGFMHAPATGVVVAELVTGKTPSIDITPLSPARFGGVLVEETNVI